jgi:hypothetical protein
MVPGFSGLVEGKGKILKKLLILDTHVEFVRKRLDEGKYPGLPGGIHLSSVEFLCLAFLKIVTVTSGLPTTTAR